MRLATYAAVAVAIVLVVIKFVAWNASGSVALLGSLFDSLMDFAVSVLNLLAVRQALVPADHDHRFGHGKVEALAGLGQATLISLSAAYLLFESYSRLANPEIIESGDLAIGVMIISMVLTLGLILYQRRVAQASGSLAIAADELHYRGDLLINGGVIVALVLSIAFGWLEADGFFGLGIAIYLFHAAWQIGRQSTDQLMDRELPDDVRTQVKKIALDHPRVKAVHDLRTRSAGRKQFIQMHLEMDPKISLTDAHRISDEVEGALMKTFPRAEILIHQDPEGHEEVSKLAQS